MVCTSLSTLTISVGSGSSATMCGDSGAAFFLSVGDVVNDAAASGAWAAACALRRAHKYLMEGD